MKVSLLASATIYKIGAANVLIISIVATIALKLYQTIDLIF